MQQPSVGRVVHYVSAGSADGKFPSVCRAAIITEVGDQNASQIGLMVLNPTGIHFRPLAEDGVLYAAREEGTAAAPYTWHWPERV
jgi:hypothetical protein